MSTGARKPASRRKSNAAASKKGNVTQGKPKASPELREAAEQDAARVQALEALYRPLRDAGEAELKESKSGRKLLEAADALARELSEVLEGITSGKTLSDEAELRRRERLEEFGRRHGDQFVEAHARHAHLKPSVEAVAQILRPDMASQTVWVSETSPTGSMLLQPKTTPSTPADVGVVAQGLGDSPPPVVRSCVTPPYGLKENYMVPAVISSAAEPGISGAYPDRGLCLIGGNCFSTPLIHIDGMICSAFVGQDFPVPPGPTKYETTISYEWRCWGSGIADFGVAVSNCDLAIVIDKRDGTRETHAREVSLLTVPIWTDWYHHEAKGSLTIPFTRDGSNGTVRIMVGADGHCWSASFFGSADFEADATIKEICLTSVG